MAFPAYWRRYKCQSHTNLRAGKHLVRGWTLPPLNITLLLQGSFDTLLVFMSYNNALSTFTQDLLQPIFVSAEDYGDLYLDIADAYMENSEFFTIVDETSINADINHTHPCIQLLSW